MQVDIFDVGHGACAVVTSPNGCCMMIDCGANPDRQWWPSIHYLGRKIDVLAITNFDEDHVADFAGMKELANIQRYQLNNTVNATALARMKADGGMGNGISALHQLLSADSNGATFPPLDFSPVQYRPYYNLYNKPFTDPNNLSLVMIIQYGGFKMIFPGDLEVTGWKKLLEKDRKSVV